jgi:hypothetical protein
MDVLYNIAQATLPVLAVTYIIYRWIKQYHIELNLDNMIIAYFKKEKINVIEIRELNTSETLKHKIGLLGSRPSVINIFTPINKNYLRVVKIEDLNNSTLLKLISVNIHAQKISSHAEINNIKEF